LISNRWQYLRAASVKAQSSQSEKCIAISYK